MQSDDCYGCLFCRVGSESTVLNAIQQGATGISAMIPKKLRMNRHSSQAFVDEVILFPGYVFFKCERDFDIRVFNLIPGLYKVLKNSDGEWELSGSDKDMVSSLFSSGGTIGFSKAYYEGNRIRIVEGALKGYESSIIRVNRRAKTAQVQLIFRGKTIHVWLGYELIELLPDGITSI